MTSWRRAGKEPDLTIKVNGKDIRAFTGDSVATALLASGITHFSNNAKTGEPSAPACLIGICFGCLCTIDGRHGSQACLEPVREGLIVEIDEATS